jgi:hypothetical protein
MTDQANEDLDEALPKIARLLCRQALDITGLELQKLEKEEFLQNSAPCLLEIFESMKAADPAQVQEFIDEFNIDPTDLFSYPANPNDFARLGSILGFQEGFGSAISLPSEKISSLRLASLLIFYVSGIYAAEARYEKSQNQSYSQFMALVDGPISQIHHLCTLAKAKDPALELMRAKHARIEGGRKGGLAKGKRKAELQELVIEKADSHYSNESASEAARQLIETLNDSWLKDESGEYIYKDLNRNFENWIRQSRKKKSTIPE